MMLPVFRVATILSALVIAYGVFATVIVIRALLKGRDREFSIRYVEFLEQKRRVEERLRGQRDA